MRFLTLFLSLIGAPDDVLASFSRARFERVRPIILEVTSSPFDAAIVAGVMWTESDFVPDARNARTQAAGLMQIMPFHFARFGWEGARYGEWANPAENIRAGYFLLRQHGLGVQPIRAALAEYGGFVTVDPSDYIAKVLTRAAWLFPELVAQDSGPSQFQLSPSSVWVSGPGPR